jgi:hypothetical protein
MQRLHPPAASSSLQPGRFVTAIALDAKPLASKISARPNVGRAAH